MLAIIIFLIKTWNGNYVGESVFVLDCWPVGLLLSLWTVNGWNKKSLNMIELQNPTSRTMPISEGYCSASAWAAHRCPLSYFSSWVVKLFCFHVSYLLATLFRILFPNRSDGEQRVYMAAVLSKLTTTFFPSLYDLHVEKWRCCSIS